MMNQPKPLRNNRLTTNPKMRACIAQRQSRDWCFALKYKFHLVLSGIVLLLFLNIGAVHANSIVVNINAPDVNDDGFCSLIEAIENAEDTTTGQPHSDCSAGDPSGPDTINLSNTTYSLTGPYLSNNGLPPITTAITIEGNGAAIERSGAAVDEFRIFFVSDTGDLTINNLTIAGGYNPSDSAGGIYSSGVLVLNSSTVTGNTGSTGGGIENDGGTMTITDSTISNNTAVLEGGGGVWNNANGLMEINGTTITGNQATNGNGGDGGGVANVTLFGAVPQLTINNSTISGNFASADGGGVANIGGVLTINQSTINNNNATVVGGGVINEASATVEINQSTISNNIAGSSGGGIGSIAVGSTTGASLNNVTVTGNNALVSGGGIYTFAFTGIGTLNLNRTIVSGNMAESGREHFNDGGNIAADNHNLFGYNGDSGLVGVTAGSSDVVPAAGIMVSDILDTNLANNGSKPHPFTHALVLNSPAIDGAPSSACTTAPHDVDQRGGIRNIDGDSSVSSNECDIGAFEFGSTVDPTNVSIQSLNVRNKASSGVWAGGMAGVLLVLTAIVFSQSFKEFWWKKDIRRGNCHGDDGINLL